MNKIKLSAVAIFVALASNAHASLVNANIDYQEYRNFAENKGKYQVGAVNIPVYDKQGNLLGTALPKDIPMPDFSAVDSNRYLSGLVGNQYIASVKPMRISLVHVSVKIIKTMMCTPINIL